MSRRATHEWHYPPLYFSREEAARYVGVGSTLFDSEVARGLWPHPTRRGAKGGRLTWYRPALDRAAAERETGGQSDDGKSFDDWRGGFASRKPVPRPMKRR